MPLEAGQRTSGVIVGNTIRTLGDKDAIAIKFEADGQTEEALIFLTPKSMGIARAQLRVCGFNPDEGLVELIKNPTRLAGRQIPIEVEEYNNRLQFRIPTASAPNASRIAELDKAIKAAKKDGEAEIAEEDIPF